MKMMSKMTSMATKIKAILLQKKTLAAIIHLKFIQLTN